MNENPHRVEDHDLGLSHDLPKIVERSGMGRRGLLALFGGVGAAAVARCASDDTGSAASSGSSSSSQDTGGGQGQPPSGGGDSDVEVADGEIPEETAGPYPGDGSNGPDVLRRAGSSAATSPELRLRLRHRRGGAADHPDEGLRPQRRRRRDPRRRRGLRLALRPRGPLLDVRLRGRRRELPARRPGGRRRGQGRVHEHLPGGVLRSLAARALRGLPEPRRRDQRPQQAAHLAAGAARGRLHGGVRDRRATRTA